jgi:hypothetical protein
LALRAAWALHIHTGVLDRIEDKRRVAGRRVNLHTLAVLEGLGRGALRELVTDTVPIVEDSVGAELLATDTVIPVEVGGTRALAFRVLT